MNARRVAARTLQQLLPLTPGPLPAASEEVAAKLVAGMAGVLDADSVAAVAASGASAIPGIPVGSGVPAPFLDVMHKVRCPRGTARPGAAPRG